MPTYEYRCPNGHEFERFYRTISGAPAEEHCPDCGVVAVRKISAGGGLLFKGSGFYLTDYGKNAHRGTAPAKKGDGESGKSSDAKASETKSSGDAAPKPASESASKPAATEKPAASKTPKPKKE